MVGYRKLGRRSDHRRAMLRNAVTSFLAKERMMTTEARAREVQRTAEKLITLAKAGGLANYRRTLAFLYDESVANKLFNQIGPRYKDRNGGYTRIVKAGVRRGDAAPQALIELV